LIAFGGSSAKSHEVDAKPCTKSLATEDQPPHRDRMLRAALFACLIARPALACETALVLSIDVSGSIDRGDYRLQTDGLASALSDPEVAEALVRGQIALAVVQWSGAAEQALVLSWQRMLAPDDVARFAARAATMPRAFTGSDTAVGQGLSFAQDQFAAVPDCLRRVIDVSGDGQENAGFTDALARSEAMDAAIMINAIAIEEPGPAFPITNYYRKWIITPGGFVVSARGLQDYAETLRLKLLRELVKPIG
jgi:Ca-activated chloride channel homolog